MKETRKVWESLPSEKHRRVKKKKRKNVREKKEKPKQKRQQKAAATVKTADSRCTAGVFRVFQTTGKHTAEFQVCSRVFRGVPDDRQTCSRVFRFSAGFRWQIYFRSGGSSGGDLNTLDTK